MSPNEVCWNRYPPMNCGLPKGHHGRHACTCGCGNSWENENETRPCPSTAVAVLGVVGDPAIVRCGLLADHDGEHWWSIRWTDPVAQEGTT